MPRLHIFNPETDYALASGRPQYTPPKQVVQLRRALAALPALYADEGDAILMLDGDIADTPYLRLARIRGVRVVRCDELKRMDAECIEPWGWNPPLAGMLKRLGVDQAMLPSAETLSRLRSLAHRRTTIPFHRMMQSPGPLPLEITTPEELRSYLGLHPDCYLKAPWSSSGRGVVHSLAMSADAVVRWGEGIIKRQGSVMAEENRGRLLDFASEWMLHEGKADYRGLSLFKANCFGRYEGNLSASEDYLLAEISRCREFDEAILESQRRALEALVAPDYRGPVGIDMLIRADGSVNPCVELNLRHTMGMVAQSLYRLTGRRRLFNPLEPGELKE